MQASRSRLHRRSRRPEEKVKPSKWAHLTAKALRALGWVGCCACTGLLILGCWRALAAQSLRHDPRRHGGGRHAGAHDNFFLAGADVYNGGGEREGYSRHNAPPPCSGVKLRLPSVVFASPGGTWQPQPVFRRTVTLPKYHGVARRKPALPTWIVTNGSRSTTIGTVGSPFSPSGQYLALLRFPASAEGSSVQVSHEIDADPLPFAEVLVVNRWNGQEVVVAKTRGWAPQAGAYLQWGVSDSQLFYNDVVHGSPYESSAPAAGGIAEPTTTAAAEESLKPVATLARAVGVRQNPFSGVKTVLQCPVFHVGKKSAKFALAPCLRRLAHLSPGHGIHVPGPSSARRGMRAGATANASTTANGASSVAEAAWEGSASLHDKPASEVHDDGLWVIDSMGAGNCRLLVALAQLLDSDLFSGLVSLNRDPSAIRLHGTHAEFSPNENMLLFVVRSDSSLRSQAQGKGHASASTRTTRSRTSRSRRRQANDDDDDVIMHHAIVMDVQVLASLQSGEEQLRVLNWRRVLSWRDGEGSHPTWGEMSPAAAAAAASSSSSEDSSRDDSTSNDSKGIQDRVRGSGSSNDSPISDAVDHSSQTRRNRQGKTKGNVINAELVLNLQWPNRNHSRSVVACHVQTILSPSASSSSGGLVGEEDRRKERCRLLGPCGSGYPVMVGKTGLALTDSSPSECKKFKGLAKPGAAPLRLLLPPNAVSSGDGDATSMPLPRVRSSSSSSSSRSRSSSDRSRSGDISRMSSIMESVDEEIEEEEEEEGEEEEAFSEEAPDAPAVVPERGTVSSLSTFAAAATQPAQTTAAAAPDLSSAMASEVELLQVMSSPSLRLSGRLPSSFSSPSGKVSTRANSNARGDAAARKLAWRGHMRPALDRSAHWVAFHGRPSGQQQQVLVAYLGDPDQLWLLGVQY